MSSSRQKIIGILRNPFRILRSVTSRIYGKLRFPLRSYCPVCKRGSFFRFGTYEQPRRYHASCSTCGSAERHRFMWLHLKAAIDKPRASILHFAPEKCISRLLDKKYGQDYITCDITPGRAKAVVDITDIEYSDESFDFIICCHVLEHVPDDKRAFSELYRVLKNGGTAFIAVPIKGDSTDEDLSVVDPAERLKRFGLSDHVRYYGLDIKDRIEEAGFSVNIVEPADVMPDEDIRDLLGIDTEAAGVLFCCRKNDYLHPRNG